MDQYETTMKSVSREDAQRQFQELLEQVIRDKVGITIEEDGRPVAVVTPIEDHNRRRARRRFLKAVREMQQEANLSAEEAEELAREAVEAVRARSN